MALNLKISASCLKIQSKGQSSMDSILMLGGILFFSLIVGIAFLTAGTSISESSDSLTTIEGIKQTISSFGSDKTESIVPTNPCGNGTIDTSQGEECDFVEEVPIFVESKDTCSEATSDSKPNGDLSCFPVGSSSECLVDASSCTAPVPFCGNGTCDSGENCSTCLSDCAGITDGICSLGCFSGNDVDCSGLRDLASSKSRYIGTVQGGPLGVLLPPPPPNPKYEEKYVEILAREYNILAGSNDMGFRKIHPQLNTYSFEVADLTVEFAKNHGQKIFSQPLIYHHKFFTPDFLMDSDEETGPELEIIMVDHIETVVAYYRVNYPGEVVVWEVVNEALSGCNSETEFNLRGEKECSFDQQVGLDPNIWIKIDEGHYKGYYIVKAFELARQTDLSAKLYYNDYGIEGGNEYNEQKFQNLISFLAYLKGKGAPIDGVGFQMHLTLDNSPSKDSLKSKFSQLADMGLEVYISEMDVKIKKDDGVTEDELLKQAQIYRDVMEACLESPNCKGLITWGLTDKYSWVNTAIYGSALVFDKDYLPKPAYYSLEEALKNA